MYNILKYTIEMDSFILSPDIVGRILLAAFLGAITGIERDIHSRPAGLRTNMVIAVSSCLMTILSIDVFLPMSPEVDFTRMTAAIISGVGFLGAGVIMHQENGIQGMTTAAQIWLVSGIGMAVGVHAYSLAIFACLFMVIALVTLAPLSHKFSEIGAKNNRVRSEKNGQH